MPAAPVIDAAREVELAGAARREGRVFDAKQHLETAVAADATLAIPRLDLTELLLQAGSDIARAAELVDQAERLGAAGIRVYRLRGWIAELEGDDAAAARAYASVLAAAPDPDLRLRRGLILRRLASWEEASAELGLVIAERPNDRAAHSGLAEVQEAQGHLAAAEGELLKLAALAPDDPVPQRRLAAFYRRHGEAAKARLADARAQRLEGPPRALRPLRPSKR